MRFVVLLKCRHCFIGGRCLTSLTKALVMRTLQSMFKNIEAAQNLLMKLQGLIR
jgi:hypothetical protein